MPASAQPPAAPRPRQRLRALTAAVVLVLPLGACAAEEPEDPEEGLDIQTTSPADILTEGQSGTGASEPSSNATNTAPSPTAGAPTE